MKNLTVKKLNRDDFPVKDYDNYYLNLDELFKPDNTPTQLEIEIAQLIMEELKIDADTEIIEFRATTTILVSFLLNLNWKVAILKTERE
jgi:hypothetical protein